MPANVDKLNREPDFIDTFLPWSDLPQKLCRQLCQKDNKEEKPSDYVNY